MRMKRDNGVVILGKLACGWIPGGEGRGANKQQFTMIQTYKSSRNLPLIHTENRTATYPGCPPSQRCARRCSLGQRTPPSSGTGLPGPLVSAEGYCPVDVLKKTKNKKSTCELKSKPEPHPQRLPMCCSQCVRRDGPWCLPPQLRDG